MFAIKYAQNVQSNFVTGKCSVGDALKGRKRLNLTSLDPQFCVVNGSRGTKSAEKSMVSVIKQVLDCAITVCSKVFSFTSLPSVSIVLDIVRMDWKWVSQSAL